MSFFLIFRKTFVTFVALVLLPLHLFSSEKGYTLNKMAPLSQQTHLQAGNKNSFDCFVSPERLSIT